MRNTALRSIANQLSRHRYRCCNDIPAPRHLLTTLSNVRPFPPAKGTVNLTAQRRTRPSRAPLLWPGPPPCAAVGAVTPCQCRGAVGCADAMRLDDQADAMPLPWLLMLLKRPPPPTDQMCHRAATPALPALLSQCAPTAHTTPLSSSKAPQRCRRYGLLPPVPKLGDLPRPHRHLDAAGALALALPALPLPLPGGGGGGRMPASACSLRMCPMRSPRELPTSRPTSLLLR